MPARSGASSARRPRRSSSIPAMSTTAPSRPRPDSRAKRKASSIAATPTLPWPCSRRACVRSKAPKRRAARQAAWPLSPPPCCVSLKLATMSSRRGLCSAAAATSSTTCCRGSASQRRWSTAATLTPGRQRSSPTRAPFSSRRPPIPCSSSWTSKPLPESRKKPARSSWSITSSPRRSSSGRCRSAPTSLSIQRPSILTARDGASAASCSDRRSSSRRRFTTISRIPGRRSAHSMPGCC